MSENASRRQDYAEYGGLIFDLDGTLVDTMPAHFQAWTLTAQRYGLTFPESRFYALGGVPAVQIVELLAREAGVELDAIAVAHEKEQLYFDRLEAVHLVQPVVEIVQTMAGIRPLAVATGSPRWIADAILERVELRPQFQTIVTADDVERPKPAPDMFLLAASGLGVEPHRCIVFEDADPGLEGARAAGMDTVDIRSLHPHPSTLNP